MKLLRYRMVELLPKEITDKDECFILCRTRVYVSFLTLTTIQLLCADFPSNSSYGFKNAKSF